MPTARATAMNGKVLTWAREQAGLTVEQLARMVGRDVATIIAWEDGEQAPTLRQLERLAAQLKRPLAVFFFSEVPVGPSPRREFRMLPVPLDEGEAKDTSFALREAQARQMSIVDLGGGQNPAGDRFLFARTADALQPSQLRAVLGVSLEQQQSIPGAQEAFKTWRASVEAAGVFVFKRAFKQQAISGFCMPHAVAPVVVINNSTTWTRQIFTLFHELCHLAHHHHGVTRGDPGYLPTLDESERHVEVECNRFASEFLVPSSDFEPHAARWSGAEAELEVFASRYNVSREVILRRLLDLGRVAPATYEEWSKRWNQDLFARVGRGSGGNFHATTASYLGRGYLQLAFSAYLRGDIALFELAEHLGVKAKHVGKLEPYLEATGS